MMCVGGDFCKSYSLATCLDQVTQDKFQLSFGYPQGWILHNLTGQIAQISDYPHWEIVFLIST